MISRIKYIFGLIFDRKISLYKKYNILLLFIERFFTKNTRLFSRPYLYIIEATTFCNLRCKKCVHAKEGDITIGNLTFEDFEEILNKIKKYAIVIGFVNWGEAFFNKDIFRMFKRCIEERITVDFSSNFNFNNKKLLEQIVDSGIGHLTISVDGVTQETYEKYRNGGNLKLVLDNIKYIQEYKKQVNSENPQIFWQFLVNKYNESEMDKAKEMARELDVSIFFNKFRPTMHREVFMTDREKYEDLKDWFLQKSDISYKNILSKGERRRCFNPWIMSIINFDGGVYPCCSLVGEQYYFGNLLKESFAEIWNNDKFISARKIILKRDNISSQGGVVCSVCKNNNFTLY